MGKKSDPETTHYWQKHVESLQSSGLTRKAYCEENQIKSSTLDYWRKKIKQSERRNNTKGTGWIPLRISDEEASHINLRVGRITVEVKPGFDRGLLIELLQAIGAAC